MTLDLLQGMENYLGASFGSIVILAIGILIFFTVAFMIAGIDFRIVLLLDTILIIGFARMAWLPSYIEGIFWVLVIGIGLYLVWLNISDR